MKVVVPWHTGLSALERLPSEIIPAYSQWSSARGDSLRRGYIAVAECLAESRCAPLYSLACALAALSKTANKYVAALRQRECRGRGDATLRKWSRAAGLAA